MTDVPDEIDAITDQWARERPGLDLSAMGIFGRFGRVALLAGRTVDEVFAAHGLRGGEFDVLAALRRSGAPYELTPSVLSDTLMLSRAGMTNRLDRLESAGLVERRLDPDDRRSFLVALTPRGIEVVEAAVDEHVANEARVLSALSAKDRAHLDRILRTLLASLTD